MTSSNASYMCSFWILFFISLFVSDGLGILLAILFFTFAVYSTYQNSKGKFKRKSISLVSKVDGYICPICLTKVEKESNTCPNCGHKI